MVWLGLRLSLRSGREALIRLLLTALAVGIGAALLFCVLADYHAFQASNNRQCWECTQGPASNGTATPTPGAELWQSSADYFDGQTIERLHLATLGPHRPLRACPGCPALASSPPRPRWPRCCARGRGTSWAVVIRAGSSARSATRL